ncbi:biopolymer transporter ExbD [Crocosphaera sp. UHCC 0190]|uniref:ExbD/TolR family protein n=1 Tax=Crocosphaera sp. UHCC 0190 TaxID=3110246 RepID=UPI002B20438B|nr:biopolymer transporter ExbD [Crocosphaera sp. UHCC 0190]MEA5509767.1 biopolymer transporter ExbD [Crocosphaera sp. UHCC 0190]
MRFKSQRHSSSMPNIDIIPMLNVMIAVLAFFVVVSMELTPSPQGVNIQLPSEQKAENEPIPKQPNYLLITIQSNEKFKINNNNLDNLEQVMLPVQDYLNREKEGIILLVAEPNVSYEKVIQVLTQLRDVGGERVSLGFEGE